MERRGGYRGRRGRGGDAAARVALGRGGPCGPCGPCGTYGTIGTYGTYGTIGTYGTYGTIGTYGTYGTIGRFLWVVRYVVRCAVLCIPLAGCADYWWGDGPGATAAVTTPSGVQSGNVAITYTLTGDGGSTGIAVKYSTDGLYFVQAAEAPSSDGTRDLSVSPDGDVHTFVWDSGANLGGQRASTVYVQVTPDGGTSDSTARMRVHNLRYLGAVENPATSGSGGRFRLYSLDAVTGRVRFLQTSSTGGLDPHDTVYDGGIFFVANESSGNIAAFQLDGVQGFVLPLAGSPFAAGVSRPRYLAADGTRVFVSGSGDSVGVLERDQSTGALGFRSSAHVEGCRGLAVRSGILYVASETRSEIAIFEVESDGTLIRSASSPVVGGGLAAPRTLIVLGTRVYAAGASSASVAGFNVLGGGGLAPIAGSPFGISSPAGEALSVSGGRLHGVGGAGPWSLSILAVDAFGWAAEDARSPLGLAAPSYAVAAVGDVVAVATTSDRRLSTWTLDATGGIVSGEASPHDTQVQLIRMAVSD